MSESGLNLSSLREKISSKLNDSQKSSKTNKKAAKKDSHKTSKKSNHDEPVNSSAAVQETAAKAKGSKSAESDVLRREALALGASEKDLELVAGLSDDDDVSEQEFDNTKAETDAAFTDDFQKFLKNAGIEGAPIPEDVKDEAAEAEEEKDEQEAVSYTHLDVYKRQLYIRTYVSRIITL